MVDDYVSTNREIWDADAGNWVELAKERWSLEAPLWGNWGNPDDGLALLPADMTGLAAIELGCGAGYVSGWMAKRGAQVTGVDISKAQLATARRLAADNGAEIAFLELNAEDTGLQGASFDFAISEYGASIWCRPEKWLREAWRLLRPGAPLVFLGNHPLSLVCSPLDGSPAERVMHRPYRDMWGADWTKVEFEPSGVCFNLTVADWMDLFREIGFEITGYRELYAPEWAMGTRAAIPAEWAKSYPVEQVWYLKKRA